MRTPTVYAAFVRAGRLAELEGTTFEDEPWPDPIVDFDLSYMSEPRELDLPVAHFGDSDLPAGWQARHDAMPPGWYLARPSQRRDGHWTVYTIDTTDRTRTAVGQTQVECVREMARCQQEISERRVPT